MAATLVQKSVRIPPSTWKHLRLNAELSGVALRDYLTYLIDKSEPIDHADEAVLQRMSVIVATNRAAGEA